MKRAALYVRVSTQEQKNSGLSVDSQIDALKKYCEEQGYTVAGIYNDAGISARKKYTKRPALLQLLEDCKQHKIDIILFTRLDRWFRAVAGYYEVQSVLDACKVPWRAIWEDYETETSQGIFKVNIMLSVAQAEADRDSEKIRSVMEFKRSNKEYIGGKVPVGYRVEGKKIVKDEKTRQIIEDMFEHYFRTFSKAGTADYILNKYPDFIRTRTRLVKIMSSPAYHGEMYGVKNYCEPYISEEQAQRIDEVSSQKYSFDAKRRIYIFSGLMRCPICGYRLSGRAMGRKENRHKVYQCPKSAAQKHKTYTRSEKKLETYMLNHLEEKLSVEIMKAEGRIKSSGNEAEKKKKKLSSELERLNKMFEKGRITEEYYDERYDTVLKELKELSQDIVVKELESKKKIQSRLSEGWKDLYLQLGEQDKQVFWKSIIKEIKISPDIFVEDIIFF